jgi:non-ribosomal peptide synthetase component E (peptide arylation enzyme)
MTTKTVYARMAESAALWPDRPVLEVMNETAKAYGIAAGSISYADFQKNADDWADRFEAKGYGTGVRVAVLL